jgi:hypothetical protein
MEIELSGQTRVSETRPKLIALRSIHEDRKVRRLWRKACKVLYFIGIMLSFLQRVKTYGAIRQAEHLNQIVKEKKTKKRKASLVCMNEIKKIDFTFRI